MLLEDQGRRVGVVAERLRDVLRDPEARAPVSERQHAAAVDAADHRARPVVVRQGHDRVGVRVDHGLGGEKPVQQRLDRGARAADVLEGVREVGDHLLVGHVLAVEQRQDVVHPDPGEILLLDRLEI